MTPFLKNYNPTAWMIHPLLKIGLCDRTKVPYLDIYSRKELTCRDGEIIALDRYPNNYEDLDDNIPTIVVVPGYLGDSRAIYIAQYCEDIYKRLGWRSCIYNRRGYGGMPFKVKIF